VKAKWARVITNL